MESENLWLPTDVGLRNLTNPKAPSLPKEMRPQAVSAAELYAHSGSTGKEGEVWCSLKGRLPASWRESPGPRFWKGKGKRGKHKKKLCLVCPWDSYSCSPSSLQEGMSVLKKKKKKILPALSLKAALSCGDLKGVKVVTLQNWTLPRGSVFAINQHQPKSGTQEGGYDR